MERHGEVGELYMMNFHLRGSVVRTLGTGRRESDSPRVACIKCAFKMLGTAMIRYLTYLSRAEASYSF